MFYFLLNITIINAFVAKHIPETLVNQSFLIISAEKLGFENFIPPFATATGTDIVSGLNYASGSAGIRDETGQQQVTSL